MRLLTFQAGGERRLGVEIEDQVVDVAAAYGALPSWARRDDVPALPSDLLALLQAGEPAMAAARQLAAVAAESLAAGKGLAGDGRPAVYPIAAVRILAPIQRPGKIICIGLNYRDHALETGQPIPEVPVIFAKFANTIVGPGEPVILPAASNRLDYEVELAVVIGKAGRRIPVESGYEHVAGYTILNDVSARDHQFETTQWIRGKTADTFAPTGPYLVTPDEAPGLPELDVRLWVNGELRQSSNTRQLIFSVPHLISFLSQTITLEPGDVISTGTPSGVGHARKPPVYLKPGDVMRLEIEKLGVLENPCIAE
ncbi:MAG: fumarylacetoacetate hydrolase family protein [Chloroflexi bacterium]|nr:fumarylacetoacetate hydrolase family protein [Chloroflexota bacterium]